MSNGTEYFVSPRAPGVRPQDNPDYDGVTFVYVFTEVLSPWNQPPVNQNVTIVVANNAGFVPGMTIVIDNGGYYEVVSTENVGQMTIMNFGTNYNAAPGTAIPPGKVTTTSLPGPPGGVGPPGPPGQTGPAGPQGPQGNPSSVPGPQGPQGAPGPQCATGPTGPTGPTGSVGPQGPPGGASAYTTLTSSFTMPAVNGSAVANVASGTANAFNLGGIVYISPIGYLGVTAINTGANQLTLQNLGYSVNQAPGSVATSGTTVTATGPQGPQGPQGASGPTGPQGTAGNTGPTGPTGATGTAATISVGTTSTISPGSNATVTNSGSSSAAVFNFGIPQGITGAQGPAGATGSVGPQGPQGIQGPQGTAGAQGATGATGPAGPTAVSTDAGNQSRLGSDTLIYTPGGINGLLSKSAAYTLTIADRSKYVICTGGSWTLTLPAGAAGLTYYVRNDMGIGGTIGTITLAAQSGFFVDGLASIPLLPQQECVLICDGANWRSFGKQRTVVLGTVDATTAQASIVVLLPVGYRMFEFDLDGIVGSAAANLQAVFSLDGGNTWQNTAIYSYVFGYNTSLSAWAVSGVTGATFAFLGILGTTADYGKCALKLYPGGPSAAPNYLSEFGAYNGSFGCERFVTYGNANLTRINAISFYPASGTINNCFLTVKGIV
jgi:hypothetical protein